MDSPGTSSDVDQASSNKANILTNKFLSGELSFAEYSNEWYKDDDENVDTTRKQEPEAIHSLLPMKEKRPRARKIPHLTGALIGLMGEANLRFVRGDKETAEKMCHEIIKLVPTAPEPYQTLAQIYEHDPEKSLQFSLLAAHLSIPDANEWLRLAAISKQRNDVKQEMICYSQAIQAAPQNIVLHLKRLDRITELEEENYPLSTVNVSRIKCYQKIIASLLPTEAEIIMKYARLALKYFHDNNEVEKALEVLMLAYKKCCTHFNLADINIFLELLILRKQYQMCIEVFITNLGIDIEAEIETVKNDDGEIEEHTEYLNCSIPHDMPIDLKSKLLICFIHLGAHTLVQTLLSDFLANDVEKAGDLYMDIEEALSAVGKHELAIKLLEPLVRNHSFDLGAVWLKHADCLYNLGKEDDAIESYYKVLKHAPQHSDARKKLFHILEKKGKIDEALDIIQQDYSYVVSAGLLYEQCLALKKYNRLKEYLKVGEEFLSKSFVKYRNVEELRVAFHLKGNLIEVLHNFRITRGENPYNADEIPFDEEEPFKLTPAEEWAIFTDLLRVACNLKKYYVMQRLSYGAMMCKNLTSYRTQIEFFCLQSSLLAKDYTKVFKILKEHTVKYSTPRMWNLLNLVIHQVEDITPKFLSRLFQREHYVVKNILLGNSFLSSGRYLVALKYFLDHHTQHKEPLSALLIAITMIVMAAQRTVDKHHNLILQGICYLLTYQKLRNCDQETYYNLGRAYQMLTINNLAIEYYDRALAAKPIHECPKHGVMSLTKEIAFNMCLLYKDQSPQLARRYMLKYLVIE